VSATLGTVRRAEAAAKAIPPSAGSNSIAS
jgi:hypothetical protein